MEIWLQRRMNLSDRIVYIFFLQIFTFVKEFGIGANLNFMMTFQNIQVQIHLIILDMLKMIFIFSRNNTWDFQEWNNVERAFCKCVVVLNYKASSFNLQNGFCDLDPIFYLVEWFYNTFLSLDFEIQILWVVEPKFIFAWNPIQFVVELETCELNSLCEWWALQKISFKAFHFQFRVFFFIFRYNIQL